MVKTVVSYQVAGAGRSSITKGRLNKYWTLGTILLIAIIAIGGIVAGSRYSPG